MDKQYIRPERFYEYFILASHFSLQLSFYFYFFCHVLCETNHIANNFTKNNI